MSLIIGVTPIPPFATGCALDPECSERGYAVDMALIACNYLKLNCSFALYTGTIGSANDSGYGTGLIGAIQRSEFDTSDPIIVPTYTRSLAVAFTQAYFYLDIVMATRMPNAVQETLNWSFLYAFQWPIILACIFSLIITSIFITLTRVFIQYIQNYQKVPGRIFFSKNRVHFVTHKRSC